MKRPVLAALVTALLLTGCAGTPQSREAGRTLVVSVFGAEKGAEGLTLLAAAEDRGETAPPRCRGTGPTPAAAVEALSAGGEQVVNAAHVEHLLLSLSAAEELPALLDYAFRDPQQSTETQLWVVDGPDLEGVFDGPTDPCRRMEVLKTAGRDRQGFLPATLRQTAGALAQGEPALIPLLDGETLERTGAVLYENGTIRARLNREEALGAALLLGQRVHWTASGEEGALSLRLVRCRLLPGWKGERLAGLTVRCVLEGVPVGGGGNGSDQAEATAKQITAALGVLRRAGGGRLLLGRAGLSRTGRWQSLADQWDRRFPALPIQVDVTIRQGL